MTKKAIMDELVKILSAEKKDNLVKLLKFLRRT